MPKSRAKSPDRQQRLAAALRANLIRRKVRARALAQDPGAADKAEAPGAREPAPDGFSEPGPIPAQKQG